MGYSFKKAFTMIELMVVCALLALIGGAISFQGVHFFNEYRYRQEVAQLKKELHFLEKLAVVIDHPLEINLLFDRNKLKLKVFFEGESESLNWLKKRELTFPHIRSFSIDGIVQKKAHFMSQKKRNEPITMRMSRGRKPASQETLDKKQDHAPYEEEAFFLLQLIPEELTCR